MLVGKLIVPANANAFLFEFDVKPAQALVRFPQQLLIDGADRFELLRRRHLVRPRVQHARFELVQKASHADHEKFVEVGPENGQEFDAFEQRIGRVLRLFEHAPLEFQQTQFAVHVQRRVVERDGRGGFLPGGSRHAARNRLANLCA